MFWRIDGAHLRVNRIGFISSKKAPEDTKMAAAVSEIYRHIVEVQGPSGPLTTLALQRKSRLGVTESITSVWDPSANASIREPT